MKLLLDENLSRRLVPFLINDYPDSTQVALIGMEKAGDKEVWDYAKTHDFVIVTRDSDYFITISAPSTASRPRWSGCAPATKPKRPHWRPC